MEFVQQLLTFVSNTAPAEWVAVVFALVYLVLAAHQSQWCWAAAVVSCSIYTVLMFDARLYMESALQLAYIALAGYGWWQWHRLGVSDQVSEKMVRGDYSVSWYVQTFLACGAVSVVIALLLLEFTDADAVWLDTFTTVYSLFATWLLTRKLFATWIYWLVIDAIYVYLYASKGFVVTGGLYGVYLLLVVYAMWQWQQLKVVGQECSSNG